MNFGVVLHLSPPYSYGMEQDRIEKLEIMIAHQERQIQDLSDMLALQGKEIDALKARLTNTQEKLRDLARNGLRDEREGLSVAEQAALDKPPHY